MQSKSSSHYISGLDGIRALAAFLVLIYHYAVITEAKIPLSFLFKQGWVGVDIFFVISGFILFMPFAESKNQPIIPYFKKRFFRIVPAYYLNMFALITISNPWFLFTSKGLQFTFLNLLFLEGFFSLQGATGLNGVFWTLCIEIQFYILLPLIARFFVGKRWFYGLLATVSLSLFYKILILYITRDDKTHEVKDMLLHQLPGVIDQFAIGMTLSAIWLYFKNRTKISRMKFSVVIGLVGFMLLLSSLWFLKTIGPTDYWFGTGDYGYAPLLFLRTILSIAAALIIFGVCYKRNILQNIFSGRIISFLGMISYGIYLWHLPLGRLFLKNIPKSLDPEQKFLVLLFAGTIFTIIWASISFFYIERPFLAKKKEKNSMSTNNSAIAV